jgi:hypothetical protein
VAQALCLGHRGLASPERLLGPFAVFIGKLGKLRREGVSLERRCQEGPPHGHVVRTLEDVSTVGLDRAEKGEDSPVA